MAEYVGADLADERRTPGHEEVREGFEKEVAERTICDVRSTAIVATIAFAVFNILDYVLYPPFYGTLTGVRLLVVTGSGIVFALAHTSFGEARGKQLAMVEYLMYGLSIVWMVHLTGGYPSPYYAGINLTLVLFLFILPLDVTRTAIVCTIIYGTYLFPMLLAPGPIEDVPIFINNNFFVVATIGLVTMSSFLATRMRFREYASRYTVAKANEELKELDVLKSQFFANISHEVRTPLTSILAPIQSMYQGDLGSLSEDQFSAVHQVYRNALRLLDMINQMLDFAKFDAKKMQLHLEPVDLGELSAELVTLFSEVGHRRGIGLYLSESGDIPTVFLDRDKMERILGNLVRNALKFTEEGRVTVSLSVRDDRIEVEVRDTGIGISSDHLQRIFERFQQIDSSSTKRYEGTGLGLTIVKEAVSLQHGTLDVSSVPNEGTRFTISLPTDLEKRVPDAFVERRRKSGDREQAGEGTPGRRREDRDRLSIEDIAFIDSATRTSPSAPPENEPHREEGEQAAEEGVRVLYVEDNEDLRSYVSKMLTRLGHRVSTAVDGREALDMLGEWMPEVVVSDVMMPRMDGYELLVSIRSDVRLRHLPFVLTTAKSEVDSRIEGLNIGADDYLAKPVNMRELDARIRNLITSARFREAIARNEELDKRIRQLSQSFSESLALRDPYTGGHSQDVLRFGTLIAGRLGLECNETFREALLLHDIGKLGIPDAILQKAAPLDEREWAVMKLHPEYGENLLLEFDAFEEVARIVGAHQERFDGTGYPKGLKGEEIPLIARIIAVADTWHAMTEDRPYRKALSGDKALSELLRGRGSQFDPEIVDTLVNVLVESGELSTELVQRVRNSARSS